MPVLRRRVTVVWVALVLLTCASTWVLSLDAIGVAVATVGIFVIAAIKIWYVMQDFMALRTAPRAARAVFGAWIVVLTLVILGFRFT